MTSAAIYAGFWLRFGAFVIDYIVTYMILWIMSGIITNLVLLDIVYVLATCGYFIIFPVSHWQATPGKHLLNIYIGRANSDIAITLPRAAARFFLSYLPYILLMLLSILISLNASAILGKSLAVLQVNEKQIKEITQKQNNHQPLTEQEDAAFDELTAKILDLSPEQIARAAVIREKTKRHEKLTDDEQKAEITDAEYTIKQTHKITFLLLSPFMITITYFLALALTIGLTRQKTGWHDLLCKTRVLRGRPQSLSPLVA